MVAGALRNGSGESQSQHFGVTKWATKRGLNNQNPQTPGCGQGSPLGPWPTLILGFGGADGMALDGNYDVPRVQNN